jgi:hypothetical protein
MGNWTSSLTRKRPGSSALLVSVVMVAVALSVLTPQAYCQGTGSTSLWSEFIKGGPAGAWIPRPENHGTPAEHQRYMG